MDRGSLEGIIKMHHLSGLALPIIPESILAKISMQILNGLMYLHIIGKSVHRDIKPANVLINSKG